MDTTKVVILAGGQGLRMYEETHSIPKPLVDIDNVPLIWHVMSRFASGGFKKFIVCLGYKSELVKSYFLTKKHTVISQTEISICIKLRNNWEVNLVYTGENTMTGGRIKRLKELLTDDFFVTYTDNLSTINTKDFYRFHKENSKKCSLTVVNLKLNYGVVTFNENAQVIDFKEKPILDNVFINAGYFICKKEIIEHIDNDDSIFETDVMPHLIKQNSIAAFYHNGFWKSIDTYKDLVEARELEIHKIIINEE